MTWTELKAVQVVQSTTHKPKTHLAYIQCFGPFTPFRLGDFGPSRAINQTSVTLVRMNRYSTQSRAKIVQICIISHLFCHYFVLDHATISPEITPLITQLAQFSAN